MHSKVINSEEDEEKNDEEEEVVKKKAQLRGSLLRHTNFLFGGNLSKLTAFEPRLTHSCLSPPVCTWLRLKAVSDAALKCAIVTLGIEEILNKNDRKEFKDLSREHVEAAKSLKSCAMALQTGKADIIENVDTENETPDPFRMNLHTRTVVESTKSYLAALEGKNSGGESSGWGTETTWAEIKLNMLPFYTVGDTRNV